MDQVTHEWVAEFTRHVNEAGVQLTELDQDELTRVIDTGAGPAEAAWLMLRMRDNLQAAWVTPDSPLIGWSTIDGSQPVLCASAANLIEWLN